MRTRFAPSPTGPLHLGHAFSALTAWDLAAAAGGMFLLRIEDIDFGRCRPAYLAALEDDLRWLGLCWPTPAMRQSERGAVYSAALDRLRAMGLLYPCTCTRAEIALAAPQEGAMGPDGPPYPGTCRGRSDFSPGAALRLDMERALAMVGDPGVLTWTETGPVAPGSYRLDPGALRGIGDVVLARRDIATSYHLAVVVDDAAQGITHVTRGADLLPSTPLHRLLQALLGLPVPVWHHHRLIRDENEVRLAKRDRARALASYREEGLGPEDIRGMLSLRRAD